MFVKGMGVGRSGCAVSCLEAGDSTPPSELVFISIPLCKKEEVHKYSQQPPKERTSDHVGRKVEVEGDLFAVSQVKVKRRFLVRQCLSRHDLLFFVQFNCCFLKCKTGSVLKKLAGCQRRLGLVRITAKRRKRKKKKEKKKKKKKDEKR